MFGANYYNQTMRRLTAIFATLFNEVYIDMVDDNNNPVKTELVPIAFVPKQKFYAALRQQTSTDYHEQKDERGRESADTRGDARVRMSAPRMAYDVGNPEYAAERQLNKHLKVYDQNDSQSGRHTLQKVPYNLNFQLFVYAKSMDSGLRIIEQILPNFDPDLTVPFKAHDQLDITEKVQFRLESITRDEEGIQGAFNESSYAEFIWTLDFTAMTNFYKPVNTQAIIEKTTARVAFDCPVDDIEFGWQESYTEK